MTLQALFPVYILVLFGYILVKSGYIPQESIRWTNLLMVRVLVPILIFQVLFKTLQKSVPDWKAIIGYGFSSFLTGAILMLVLFKVFRFSAARASIVSLGSAGSNSIFLGFPLVTVMFPQMAEKALSQVLIVENLFIIPLALIMYDVFSGGGHILSILMKTIKNPITVAIFLSLVVPLVFPDLWDPLAKALDMVGVATSGILLLLVGGMLARVKIGKELFSAATVVAGKLFLHPLLTLLILAFLGVRGDYLLIGILFASVSTFGIYANICENAGEGETAASVFFLSTVLSPLSVTFWVAITRYFSYDYFL